MINDENIKTYVDKFNELYIMTRSKYIRIKPDEDVYKTISKENAEKQGWTWKPLNDSHIEKHLKGEYSIGVFSGNENSKFLAIDVDLDDKTDKMKLKWIYNQIVQAFDSVGISKEYLHVAYSGGGGIHVLLFTEATSLKFFKRLYTELMQTVKDNIDNSIKVHDKENYDFYIEGYAHLEMRVTEGLAIRLDLGRNWKHKTTKNKGSFLDKDTLKPISDDYFLSIEQMPKDEFSTVMESIYDKEEYVTFTDDEIKKEEKLIKSNITEDYSHKIGRDEDTTIEYVQGLLRDGLSMSGTRNNSVFKIAKYFLYMGLDKDDAESHLIQWMTEQDTNKYSISLEEAIKECKRIVGLVYERGYALISQFADLHIYKSEIEKIMTIQNRNDKLLIYTMLLHSKRFATKDDVFYMTYKQMNEMCGISKDGAVASIKRLEELGIIEVVSRNVRRDDSYKHKPNKYKIILNVELNEIILTVSNENKLITNDFYYESITKTYNKKELKKLLPRRQYSDVIKYTKSIAI